ncbi:BatD family protein [Portibacter lacus]|uniref:Aerotolerance-like protein n=1 Tax=Portibacter lacus TaxID=1099794 RepID=A0AA37SLY5_9BACT|nr:BatD family protein [Portibacter lacus]GLR17033.1 aerotolerance-like protein [Portibacter lacus]
MRIGILLLFTFWFSFSFAQNNSVFYANASSLKVLEGDNFRVEFIMNNIKGTDFKPPVFDHFNIISGPNQTSSYSNVNGKVNQQFIYSYNLQTLKTGKFTIKAAYCNYNGDRLATAPFTITVVKRDEETLKASGLPTDKDIFVRLEVPRDSVYIGEKVSISYKLYTRKEVRSYDIKKEADYSGFFVLPQHSRDKKASQEQINGQTYNTQILEKRMLFPQQTGKFDIQGANVTLGLPDPNRRGSGFFFNSNLKSFPVKTNDLMISVIGLPSGAPTSFSGAIGTYQMEATLDKTKLSTDDAATLTITVAGNGDPKYILPPSQEHLEDFEIYDPNIIEKGEREMFGEIQTIKQFEYLIVPKKAGRQSFQAEFSYFDPGKNEYITLKSKVFQLMVEQGSGSANIVIEKEEGNDRNLTGIMPALKLSKHSKGLFGGPLHLSILGLSVLGIGFIFWKKKQLDIEAGIDPTIKKRNKARKIAEERLSQAEVFMKDENHRSFYEEISRSMLGFIADKLNVPNSEISKSNVALKLSAQGVEDEKVAEVSAILSNAELAVFAGKKDGDLEEVYIKTRDLISHLSEKI